MMIGGSRGRITTGTLAVRVALVASLAAVLIGVISIPIVLTLPTLLLCTLAPPFECMNPVLTGRQYVEGDSPAALIWLVGSLVAAPLLAVCAVGFFQRSRALARVLAAIATVPSAILFIGTYALMPFHALIAALTLSTFLFLLSTRVTAQPGDSARG